MNKSKPILLYALVALSLLLSACGAVTAPSANTGGGKPLASEYVGTIDAIVGNQWTINGITVVVDPSVVGDGPFSVGDQVKLEGSFGDDGSFTVTRVESLDDDDVASLPQFGADDGNGNSNDANSNDDDGNANSNDDDGDDNSNDDDGNANSNDDDGDDNSNDDDGNANSNDDDGDDNSNDDDGSANSNDDDDSDDNSNDDDGNANSNDDDEDDDDGNENDD